MFLIMTAESWLGPGASSAPGADDEVHDSPGDQQCQDRGGGHRAGLQEDYYKRKES